MNVHFFHIPIGFVAEVDKWCMDDEGGCDGIKLWKSITFTRIQLRII
jgi:hypothetical protein